MREGVQKMREIEFRGKGISCPNEGQWLYGYYCTERLIAPDNPDRLAHCIREQCGISNRVDPATVGQFTGLTDRNGKRIYEGDIVRTKYGRLCYIGWFSSIEYNGFDLTPIVFDGDIDCPPPDKYDLYYSGNLEVVGNVYDNLDLMERTTFRSE